MMKYAMMIVLAAVVAAGGNSAVPRTAASTNPQAEIPGIGLQEADLDRTWTTRGKENEAGSQVLASSALTSPGYFSAEGKGFCPPIHKLLLPNDLRHHA